MKTRSIGWEVAEAIGCTLAVIAGCIVAKIIGYWATASIGSWVLGLIGGSSCLCQIQTRWSPSPRVLSSAVIVAV